MWDLFSQQRKGDLSRAAGRQAAIKTGRETRRLLDRYVLARRNGGDMSAGIAVLWGRILLVLALLATVAALVVRLAR